jgi:hypothetical protein
VQNNFPNNYTRCCDVGFNKFKFYPSECGSVECGGEVWSGVASGLISSCSRVTPQYPQYPPMEPGLFLCGGEKCMGTVPPYPLEAVQDIFRRRRPF